jgi:hypothetical protein
LLSLHEVVTDLLAAVATVWVSSVVVVAVADQFTTFLTRRRHPIRRPLTH